MNDHEDLPQSHECYDPRQVADALREIREAKERAWVAEYDWIAAEREVWG